MTEKNKIHKTITPSGVFRQPREDIFQDSVSQCAVNQDSLCKVSDFEISIHSKYNLPDLCNVDGKGRAVYWLYKHSLADSESVRNCKIRTGDTTEGSLLFTSDSHTNTSMFSAMKNGKSSIPKNVRLNKNLCELRDIFLSSVSSDIEIKETYNSYINLEDLETVDMLMDGNEDLSIDKYDNLMMNLELRRLMLEKEQIERYKAFLSQNMKNKSNYVENIEYHLRRHISNTRRHLENINKFKRKTIYKKATDVGELMKSGFEAKDLDHILNQIKFFLYYGKFEEITETQKTKLENYLRLLTEESNRTELKKEYCQNSLHNTIKETIRESLRDMISREEKRQTSSLFVETDSSSDICDSPISKSAKRLKECRAQSNINLTDAALVGSPDVPVVEQLFTSSYQSNHSDVVKHLSEKELKCQDLKGKNCIDEDATEKLLLKQYHLDCSNDLIDFTKPKKPLGSNRKTKQKEEKVGKLQKFNSVRSFDEADTFKSLKLKQKHLRHEEKHTTQSTNRNICVMEPDTISYSNEQDNKHRDKVKVKITEQGKSSIKNTTYKTCKPKLKKPKNENLKKESGTHDLISKVCSDYMKKLRKTVSVLSNKSNKSEEDDVVDVRSKDFPFKSKDTKEEGATKNCVCFTEALEISSDSINDSKYIMIEPKKVNTKIKSNSFPKTQKDSAEKLSNDLDTHRDMTHKMRRRRESPRNEDEKKKVTQSDNHIYTQVKPRTRHKYQREEDREEKKTVATPVERDSKKKVEISEKKAEVKNENKDKGIKEKQCDRNEFKLFVNINALGNSTLEIRSYTKNLKSQEESRIQTGFFDEVEKPAKEAEIKTVSKINNVMNYSLTPIRKSVESAKTPRLPNPQVEMPVSNHIIQINDSLIHIDEKNMFKTTDAESMENFLKNEMLSNLHKSLVPNECEEAIDTSVNIPIFKKGVEIARITRQSPSCAYTIKKYVQKMNKSTQMFEHVTRNDLYTLQWIHDNLFEININPHTLIVDEKIKEVSEISDVS